MPSIPVGLGLFSMAWMANILNKKVQCYQQYGLTSYLASCSASLLTRKTYLATTVKSNIYVTDIKESIIQNSVGTSESVTFKSGETVDQTNSRQPMAAVGGVVNDSVQITSNSYIWAESLTNGISLNKVDSFLDGQQSTDNLDESAFSASDEASTSKLVAFKVSRDYVSSDSSEGFEDWSFLDQKRPYDSLVRENIFELLEDLELNMSEGNNFSMGLSESLGSPERVAFEEHLFSSEINKTYTNRLRLEQRIKNFYGLSHLPINNPNQKKGGSSSYDTLLQLEKRIDVQLFRLNWVSSISHARQILKHKHIGIINCKDRVGQQIKNMHEIASVAASNLFLKAGDLLYWRNKNIFYQQFDYTEKASVSNRDNLHKFPWFGYIGDTSASLGSLKAPHSESKVPLVLPMGHSEKMMSDQKAWTFPVFALGSNCGSIGLSNDINQLLTTAAYGCQISSQNVTSGGLYHPKNVEEAAKKGFLTEQSPSSLQKLSNYFEIHYKYTYAIRTSQDLKLEYLRLPQSSIQKNEWKSFLESSI